MRELTHHTARVIDRVRHGETVQVTDHGKPVARICPATSPAEAHQSLLDRLVADKQAVPASDQTPFSMPLGTWDGVDSTALISELREDRF